LRGEVAEHTAEQLDLLAVVQCDRCREALAFGGQVHLDRAPILATRTALDQSEFLATRNQRHHTMLVGLQALGELADAGPFASGIALDLEQQQVLEVGDAVAPG
jgi:hypothetical protein